MSINTQDKDSPCRQALEAADDLIAVVDKDYKYLHVNKSFADFYGKKASDIIGQTVFGLVGKEIFENKLKKDFEKCFKGERRRIVVERDYPKAGKRTVSATYNPLKKGKEVVGAVIFIRDITDFLQKIKEIEKKDFFLRQMAESTDDILTIHDKQGNYLFYNGPKKFGVKPEDMVGKNVSDLFDKEQAQPILKQIQQVIKTKERIRAVNMVEWEGEQLWFQDDLFPIEVENGKTAVAKICTNITKVKNAEKKVKESEEKYRTLVEYAPMSILLVKDEKYTFANPSGAKLMGYDQESIKGVSVWETIDPTQHEEIKGRMKRILEGQHNDITELRLLDKSGNVRVSESKSMPLNINGEVHILVVGQDITKRKNAEKRIHKYLQELQNIIEGTSNFIISVDMNGFIHEWNKAMTEAIGIPRVEAVGKSLDEQDSEQFKQIKQIIENCKKSQGSTIVEKKLTSTQGSEIKALFTCSSILNKDGQRDGYVLVGRDVTIESESAKNIQPATAYASYGDVAKRAVNAFNSFTNRKYDTLFVTRYPEPTERDVTKGTSYLYLTYEKNKDKPERLLSKLRQFIEENPKPVIFINRLDFLSTLFGFKGMLEFIYALNDYVCQKQAILLSHVNTSCFSETEVALLRQEFTELPQIKERPHLLDPEKISILKYVYNKNAFRTTVQYSDVSKNFKLSRMTTKRWLMELKRDNYLDITQTGRSKCVVITEKGKKFLHDL